MFKIFSLTFFIIIFYSLNLLSQETIKLLPPENGVYVGAFPDMGSTEDSVNLERLENYSELTGTIPVWTYFSNNWFGKIKFPKKEVEIINEYGSIPFIRLMARSDFTSNKIDPKYPLQKFIDGVFDNELTKYAIDVRKFNNPLIIEFAPEANGNWFPWSGSLNGNNPELYQNVYRHIIDIFRAQKAFNVTWVFHINYNSAPETDWNKIKNYYPGDEYIDWIGFSLYGAQIPGDEWQNFTDLMDKAYNEMSGISSEKPIAVIEFGTIEGKKKNQKATWINEAFSSIKNGRYPRVKAVSYWHSSWQNEDKSVSNMRVDSSPKSLKIYKKWINDKFYSPEIKFDSVKIR